jgi:hypothetical protein
VLVAAAAVAVDHLGRAADEFAASQLHDELGRARRFIAGIADQRRQ